MSVITIDAEVKQRIKVPYDFDAFTERLITENGYFVFPSATFWTFKKNLFYLLKNSRRIPLESRYKYKPDYLSNDEYGTVILANAIMLINNVTCIEEFDIPEVIIPTKFSIVEMCKDSFRKRSVDDLKIVNF